MCNRITKTIEISWKYIAEDDNELRRLLCHEICHAVVDGYHGQKWQKRLLIVAQRAADLGQKELVAKIYSDINNVQNSEVVSLISVHQNIEDALMDNPNASFEDVIEHVADNWSMTAKGLLKKYKTLKCFFDKAKHAALLDRELQQKYGYI